MVKLKFCSKYFLVILFLILVVFLPGCSGVTTPATNLSGNWTATNTTTSTTSTQIADIGAVTTAKCNIVNNSGSLTIYNFYIIGQPFINWNTGYGTFKNSVITANISGSYLNVYGSIVSTIVYFEGTIGSSGISGSGTWVQTVSVYGYFDSASGTTVFIKG
jgi:hypothetical protein